MRSFRFVLGVTKVFCLETDSCKAVSRCFTSVEPKTLSCARSLAQEKDRVQGFSSQSKIGVDETACNTGSLDYSSSCAEHIEILFQQMYCITTLLDAIGRQDLKVELHRCCESSMMPRLL